MSREVRSTEFHDSIFYLLRNLPHVPVPDGGFEELAPECRQHAYRVCYLFDYLGLLANKGIISENTIISWLGTRIMQVWIVAMPFIRAEREYRARECGDSTPSGFVPYFEHLVRRIIEKGGVEAAARIQRDSGVLDDDDFALPDDMAAAIVTNDPLSA